MVDFCFPMRNIANMLHARLGFGMSFWHKKECNANTLVQPDWQLCVAKSVQRVDEARMLDHTGFTASEGVQKRLDAVTTLNGRSVAAVVLCQSSQKLCCCASGDWAWVHQEQIHSCFYAMHSPQHILPG